MSDGSEAVKEQLVRVAELLRGLLADRESVLDIEIGGVLHDVEHILRDWA